MRDEGGGAGAKGIAAHRCTVVELGAESQRDDCLHTGHHRRFHLAAGAGIAAERSRDEGIGHQQPGMGHSGAHAGTAGAC